MPTSAITALATLTLGSAQATVTFSGITGAYRDLRLVMSGLTNASSDTVYCQINNQTGSALYSRVIMSGTGSSAVSSADDDTTGLRFTYYGSWNVSVLANLTVDFLDYSATDKHKTALSRSNRTDSGVDAMAHRFASTNAITSLKLTLFSGNSYAAGSTFTLYGVSA